MGKTTAVYSEIPLMSPETFFKSSNKNEIPITLSKHIVRSYMTFLITGDQGSGKTTYLKSIIRFFEPSVSIRVNEKAPEMNLRYAYPNRNIVQFYETPNISVQDGLDFQKKTSGWVNIIGEIANACAASWWVQTSKVASKSGAGTHHGKTVPDTITALSNNMIEANGYTNEKAVEQMVADALDYDIHMNRTQDGFRYCERITEVSVFKTQDYPYPDIGHADVDVKLASLHNEQEFWKRQTDRKTYEYANLCEFDMEQQCYVLKHIFSEEYIKKITHNLTRKQKEEFERDMDMLLSINPNA